MSVFLSSTAEDLKAHREKVALAIEQMGSNSIRMETFTAQPGAPVQTCIDSVKRADVLICSTPGARGRRRESENVWRR